MLEEVIAEISTGAAGNIVAYMLSGRVDALRTQAAKIFRHGTEQERSVALRAIEDGAASLSQKKVPESAVAQQWRDLLVSYLSAHPEALADVASFGVSRVAYKTIIGSQTFEGDASFGGDNNGTITINPQR